MKATYDKSKIMKNAWYLKKVQPGKSLGDCLRKAWRNEKLAMLTAKIENRPTEQPKATEYRAGAGTTAQKKRHSGILIRLMPSSLERKQYDKIEPPKIRSI